MIGISIDIPEVACRGGSKFPSWLPLVNGAAPTYYADFTSEGTTNHYWFNGTQAAGFAAWNTAITGTYTRASNATYTAGGLVATASSGNIRFPTDGSSVPLGVRLTGAQTELCLQNRDLTNAVWTATNMTVAKNQTGADGAANSASSLTATANNATVTQTVTHASSASIMGAYVKRLSGTGTVQISQDGGTTPTTIVPTASWVFYQISAIATVTNPVVWFQLGTSGDSIAVDFVSQRVATTYSNIPDAIATAAATVTQAADSLSFPFTQTSFSVLAITSQLLVNSTSLTALTGNATNNISVGVSNASPAALTRNNSVSAITGPTYSGSSLNTHKFMASGSNSGRSVTVDAASPTSDATAFVPAAPTVLFVGGVSGGFAMFGDIQQLAIWSGIVASSSELQRLTT